MNIFDLSGKKALVVGAAGGIGFAIMEGLLEAGASVVAVDVDPAINSQVIELKEKGFFVYPLLVDIADREAIKKSVLDAKILLGGDIDILVNSAGIQRRNPSESFLEQDWDDVISINLTSTFMFCQQVAAGMIKNGYGKIINIASIMSFFGGITIPAYAASKGGVAQLTKALSNDLAAKGINVNAIAPGYFDTKLNTALISDSKRSGEVLLRTPAGRWGQPDDIKGAAIFLSSSASDFVCGVILPVDGGYSAR